MACKYCTEVCMLTDVSATLPDNNQEVTARLRFDVRKDYNSIDMQLVSYYHNKTNGEIGDVSEWSDSLPIYICPFCGEVLEDDENRNVERVIISYRKYIDDSTTPVRIFDTVQEAIDFLLLQKSIGMTYNDIKQTFNISADWRALKVIVTTIFGIEPINSKKKG